MAKVKITGHASGSGVITVTAPNTSTDRTITLPDATDTLIGAATTDALTTRVNGAGGRKNIFINGDMSVAQRGTYTGVTSSQYSTCDRWNINMTDAGTWTYTQDTDVPAGQGFSHSLKLDCTTADASVAAASVIRLQYRPESQDLKQARWGTADAQPLVMSFWIKFDNVTGDFCTDVLSLDNSNNRTVSQKFTYGSAGVWQKCVFTIPADTGGNTLGVDTGGDTYFQIFLQGGSNVTSGTLNTTWATRDNTNRAAGQTLQAASSTSNNVYLTGCQLELGSTATDFEYRSYGEELALCQRYYYSWVASGLSDNHYLQSPYGYRGASPPNATGAAHHEFPTTMRANPSVTGTASWSIARITGNTNGLSVQIATLAQNNAYYITAYTADAEI
jgi:hypothetical protein